MELIWGDWLTAITKIDFTPVPFGSPPSTPVVLLKLVPGLGILFERVDVSWDTAQTRRHASFLLAQPADDNSSTCPTIFRSRLTFPCYFTRFQISASINNSYPIRTVMNSIDGVIHIRKRVCVCVCVCLFRLSKQAREEEFFLMLLFFEGFTGFGITENTNTRCSIRSGIVSFTNQSISSNLNVTANYPESPSVKCFRA